MNEPEQPPPDDPEIEKLGRIFVDHDKSAKVIPIKSARRGKTTRPAPPPPRPPRSPREFRRLPEDCPVVPLGFAGDQKFFLDASRQLRILTADKLSAKGCDDLFGTPEASRWLDQNFARFGEGGVVNGLDRDLLSRALIAGCGEAGFLSKSGKVRGEGGWADPAGRLELHVGDAILTADSQGRLYAGEPGRRDEYIYPMGNPQLRPAETAPAGVHGPGQELLELLKSWHWRRGDLDAVLMLGWIVMAPVAGALRWRPSGWIMGDMATGKSTLQDVIEATQGGRRGVVRAGNATSAGVRQELQFRCLPVILDEVEAGPNSDKATAVVELMRASASGAMVLRGGQDHHGVEFACYAPFLFSSINMLSVPPQDISRMALFELLPLSREAVRPIIDPVRLAKVGAGLRRRVVDAWPRFDEHLARWWAPINAAFGARTADTFGFLLAFAHVAHCDAMADDDTVAELVEPLIPSLQRWQEIAGRNHDLMLNRLATYQLEPWEKGRKVNVRQLIYWASRRAGRPVSGESDEDRVEQYGQGLRHSAANGALRQHGLAVVRPHEDPEEYLAIAIRHAALSRIFHGTPWAGGVWRQAADRVPGSRSAKTRFGGMPEAAVFVPVSALLGEEGEEGASA